MDFSCPTCNERMHCPDTFAGTKASCPKCGQRILIPTPPKPVPVPTNQTILGKLDDAPPVAATAPPIEKITASVPAPPASIAPPRSSSESDFRGDEPDQQPTRPNRGTGNRGNGTVALLLALLAVFFFWPLGIFAMMIGRDALKEDPDDGYAKAGYYIGFCITGLVTGAVIAGCLMVGFLGVMMFAARNAR